MRTEIKNQLIVATVAAMALIGVNVAYGSTLSKETAIPLTGANVNLTGDMADVDISIDPTTPLPPNGTRTISNEGATDMDINEFPPRGVTVIIQNESITVTKNPVTIDTTAGAVASAIGGSITDEIASTQGSSSGSSDGDGSSSSGGDEDGE